MTKEKREIIIKVIIEVDEDFNNDDLAICKYEDDGFGNEMFLPKSEDFEVLDYLSIEEK